MASTTTPPRRATAASAPGSQDLAAIGVGIDTARYGHMVSFLRPDRQPAAQKLLVMENHDSYQALRERLEQTSEVLETSEVFRIWLASGYLSGSTSYRAGETSGGEPRVRLMTSPAWSVTCRVSAMALPSRLDWTRIWYAYSEPTSSGGDSKLRIVPVGFIWLWSNQTLASLRTRRLITAERFFDDSVVDVGPAMGAPRRRCRGGCLDGNRIQLYGGISLK